METKQVVTESVTVMAKVKQEPKGAGNRWGLENMEQCIPVNVPHSIWQMSFFYGVSQTHICHVSLNSTPYSLSKSSYTMTNLSIGATTPLTINYRTVLLKPQHALFEEILWKILIWFNSTKAFKAWPMTRTISNVWELIKNAEEECLTELLI
jgi:hypothetical protein